MKIRTKILWTLLGMSLLVALVGALAVNRQRAAAVVGATKEAHDVAELVSFLLMSDANKLSMPAIQEIITRLHQKEGRDVCLMDANQRILADEDPSEIGTIFNHDPRDEAGATIRDRQVRTFVEVSPAHPAGIRQIVVPVEGESGQVIGAVVLEYTHLYDELMALTKGTILQVALAAFGSMAVALLIALYMGRSIARPLRQLATAATGFASGRTELPMLSPRQDEIGELATAFGNMVEKRQRSEDDLRSLRDELEIRVAARTVELARANEALQAENAARKQARDALQSLAQRTEQRERMLTTTLSSLNDFAYAFDREGRFLFANQPLLDLWGIPLEAAVGRNFTELGYPDDLARKLEQQIQQVFETKQNVTDETPYTSPAGLKGCYEYIFSPAVAADGTVDFVVGSTRDITARKLSEEALRESEERFSAAFQLAPIGMALVSPEGRWLKVNRALCDLVGYSEAELLARTYQSITHPDDFAVGVEKLREFLAGDATLYQMEKRYVHARGHVVTILLNVSLIRDGQGQPSYSIAQIQDITERKRSDQATERTLQRLNDAQRIGQIGDWEWDLATQAMTWSPQVFQIVGRDPRLGPPRTCEENAAHFDPVSMAWMEAKVLTVIEDGETQDCELTALRPDGERVHVLVMAAPRKDESGKVVGLCGTIQDITARKRAEAAHWESERRYRSLFENMIEGYAHCRMVCREGGLPDFIYLEVNGAFETLTGLKNVVGKTISEVIPGAREANPELFELYRRVALTGQPERCETHLKSLGIWFSISVYSHEEGHFVAVFDNVTERKRSEQAIEHTLQRLNEAQRIAQIGDWEFDLATETINWSPQVFAIFGRDPNLGPPGDFADLGALHDAASLPLLEKNVIQAIESGEAQNYELVIVRPDGERVHVQAMAVPRKGKDGGVLGLYGTVQDITARKLAEEALRLSEERLRAALLASGTGTFRWDIRTNELSWDDSLDALFGLPPGQTARSLETFIAAVHPDDRAGVIECCERCAREGSDFDMEFRVLRPDGGVHWLDDRGKTFFDGAGQPLYMTGACVDITERKRAEEELRSKTAFLEAQLNSSLDGILVVGEEGRKVLQNRRTADLFKIPAAIADGDDDASQFKWVTNSVKNPEQFVERVTFLYSHPQEISRDEIELKDGTILDRYSAPVIATDGKFYGRIWTFRDITERKRAEHELEQSRKALERLNAELEQRVMQRTESLLAATAEAERANHAKSEFLSRMSHELRTPMNAILGFAQVLEIEDGLTGDQRESVNQILKGGSHLLALINEVLDITTIDAGRIAISAEPVALQDLLAESVDLVRPLAAGQRVRLIVMREEVNGRHVLADRQRLKQVLLNLLANAIKYNRSHGSVTVRCAASADAAIRLSITDTGRGLSADQIARLFNPFERLGAEQTRVEGTGLGLILAKRMVERMGGIIGVESIVGEGSTFWIELRPAEAPAEGVEEPVRENIPLTIPEAPAARRMLLYIEDNPANVRLISRILARRPGIEMLCAETGAIGLQMARKYRPDLILLDLHLPDSHGDEVLIQLRADPSTTQIPVVMLTADVQPGKHDQLVAAGARAFLAKPVVVPSFLATIDQFIEPGD